MSEWQEVKLGELVDIGSSKRVFYEDYVNSGIPFYRSKEVIEKHNGNDISTDLFITKEKFEQIKAKYGAPQAGDLLLTSVGTLGIPYIVEEGEEFYFKDGNLTWFKNYKTNLYNKFLYYWIISPIGKNALDMMSIGSTQAALTIQGLKNLDFDAPPIEEQKAIASVLSSLDDKIDLLHRQNTTLERMADTLFRQWFVEEAQSFKLGKIGDLIEGTFGGEWGKEAPEGEFINAANCIRGTDIADLQTGLAKKIPLRFVSTKKLQSVEPKNGDIIFEISGGTETQSTGRATYINDDVRSLFTYRLVFSNFCRLLRPLNSDYTYFIYLYLSYLYGQDEFFGLENGSSGIKNLNYKALFFELDYPMPTLDRVQEFNHLVTPNFSKINQNKKQIQTLEKLRDNLLPKLMSGEVRVAL